MRDAEAATRCTLFQLRGSAIVTEMHSAGRAYDELVNTQPSVERGSPHIWFVHRAMLRGRRVGFEDPRDDHPKTRRRRKWVGTFRRQSKASVQAPPSVRKARRSTQVANHLRHQGIHVLHMEEARVLRTSESHTRRWRMCWPRRETDLTNGGCTCGSQSRTF